MSLPTRKWNAPVTSGASATQFFLRFASGPQPQRNALGVPIITTSPALPRRRTLLMPSPPFKGASIQTFHTWFHQARLGINFPGLLHTTRRKNGRPEPKIQKPPPLLLSKIFSTLSGSSMQFYMVFLLPLINPDSNCFVKRTCSPNGRLAG